MQQSQDAAWIWYLANHFQLKVHFIFNKYIPTLSQMQL